MIELLYVSGASRPMSDADIDTILETSRQNNQRLGITGMLLWADGVFVQVLEGEASKVKSLAARIARDDRHRNFMVLVEQQSDRRLFSAWSMGFRRLAADRPEDKALFQISRAALSERVGRDDGGLLLDTIAAFSRDFLTD